MLSLPLSLSDKKYDEISKRVRESFPNSCILWVDAIKNPELEIRHNALFKTIQEKYPEAHTLELFHGTTEAAAGSICSNGFITEYNTTSAYGKGTYFAKNASYSFGYSTKNSARNEILFMLLCDVIVGKIEQGKNNEKITADTAVDSIYNPSIYVSPYDAGGIPKYLIAFHKNPAL